MSSSSSVRRSVSEVRESRRSPQNEPSTSRSSDVRRSSVSSHHKKGFHEILYVNSTLRIVVSGMSGLLFGIALEKSRVFEPQVIRDQMLFKRFAMVKMFLAAVGAGIVSFSVIRTMPDARKALTLAIHEYLGCIRLKTVHSVVVGAGLLGCGMTLAGACPGLVTVQLGAGVETAVYTTLGAFSGGFLYALTFPWTSAIFRPEEERELNFLHEYVDSSYHAIALPLLIPILICILALELYSPWDLEILGPTEDLPEIEPIPESSWWDKLWYIVSLNFLFGAIRNTYPIKVIMSEETVGLMREKTWTPFFAGILVGLLQIPIVLANQDTLGTSTAYITLGAQVVTKPLQGLFTYFKDYSNGWINWWQVVFIGGSIMGGFVSSLASGNWSTVDGVSAWQAFGGGLLMIYGARLAGGCTSGHGLSGMGLLALMSFVAVPTMFASGIVTAFTLYLAGVEGFVE